MNKLILNSMDLSELTNLAISSGEKAFRASQLYMWLYHDKAGDILEMSNLSKGFRQFLAGTAEIYRPKVVQTTISQKDGSAKLLLELKDGEKIECVLLKDGERLTACISTQVGCRMGCRFCSTARIGFKRNLDTAEITEQIRILEELAVQLGYNPEARLDNIVVMGMGEPLDNPVNLVKSLKILMDANGYGYSHKRFTVSTAGLYDKIKVLYELDYPVNLAVSVNAPNQEIRTEVMPVSKAYPLGKLISEVEKLPSSKIDSVTFEYVLLGGINDSKEHAREFLKLIRKLSVKINLIVYNGGGDECFKQPKYADILAFQKILTDGGKKAFIRKSLGADIWGACGQLAAGYIKNK